MRIFKNSRKTIEWNKWQFTDRNAVIKETIQELSPSWVPEQKVEIQEEQQDLMEQLNSGLYYEELKRAIRMVRRNSSPGIDGIEYEMIRQLLPEDAKRILLELLNTVWIENEIPQDWLKYQVIFIDKVNKTKVRPISLFSCIGKTMERIVNERFS